jgi:hypothetical protein
MTLVRSSLESLAFVQLHPSSLISKHMAPSTALINVPYENLVIVVIVVMVVVMAVITVMAAGDLRWWLISALLMVGRITDERFLDVRQSMEFRSALEKAIA